MTYSNKDKTVILQKIIFKIQKEFQSCRTDRDIDTIMEKYGDFLEESNAMPVSKSKSVILVIGALAGKKSEYQLAAKKLGIPEKNIEFINDYSKLGNFNTAKLRYSEKYSDIILGPNPHKMERIDGKSSLLQAIKENPDMYPKLNVAVSNEALKISLSNFKELIKKTRYYLETI